MTTDDELLDRIYEAAILPDLWPDVLDRIAKLGRAQGGVLYAVTPQVTADKQLTLAPIPRWTASPGIKHHVEAFVRDGWLHGNIRAERAVSLASAGFVTDHDLFTEEEIRTTAFYRYARSNGIGWHLCLSVQVPTGDVMIFNFERSHAEGAVEPDILVRYDGYKAHLARSALLSSRLGLERARAGADAFSMVGLPAAILSVRGSAIAMNELFEAMIPAVVTDHGSGRIRLRDEKADCLLDRTLLEMQSLRIAEANITSVLSIPIRATHLHAAMVLHAIPIRRTARDIFEAASIIIIVTRVCRAIVPTASIIQGLFDLTKAEASVAQQIAQGSNVRDIAQRACLSHETIRSQLKSVFQKTGLSKQGDLIGLLSSIHPVRKGS